MQFLSPNFLTGLASIVEATATFVFAVLMPVAVVKATKAYSSAIAANSNRRDQR
jgi:hypothetical protein